VETWTVWSKKPRDVAEPPNAASASVLVAFSRNLRRAGLSVPVENLVQYLRAVAAVGVGRDPLYWAGRIVLVHRHEDVGTYNRVFDSFWRQFSHSHHFSPPSLDERFEELGSDDTQISYLDQPAAQAQSVTYSDVDQLRRKDFAECTPEEIAQILRLINTKSLTATQRSRRMKRSSRERGRRDPRATMKRALRSGGEVVRLVHRQPMERPRRIVLLCDVSGSMEPYARALLFFLHVAVIGRRRVEAFAIGTRLTRITRQLSSLDPDAAMSGAVERVLDWSGGTRLGEGIGNFNDRFGMPGMARGAVVVILSDGLDRGDPRHLAGEMARLHRAARQTIWVNPLRASAGYEPLARGMVASLPFVDRFVDGHSVASLDALMAVIADCA
jgi:uncharacterized protein with von Willebrand factor type A (vWA) domain